MELGYEYKKNHLPAHKLNKGESMSILVQALFSRQWAVLIVTFMCVLEPGCISLALQATFAHLIACSPRNHIVHWREAAENLSWRELCHPSKNSNLSNSLDLLKKQELNLFKRNKNRDPDERLLKML